MKIVISENQSDRFLEIIKKIISSIDFEGGVIDFKVFPPDEESDDPRFEVYLVVSSDWLHDNYGVAQMYIRRTKIFVYEKIKEITGLSVYVGNFVE